MTTDFEELIAINFIAHGKTEGGELTFRFEEALIAIRLCSKNTIAVLGIEIFEVHAGQLVWKSLSTYDQQMKKGPIQKQEWAAYVAKNSTLAEEFALSNPFGDGYVYVLTTASWRELVNAYERLTP